MTLEIYLAGAAAGFALAFAWVFRRDKASFAAGALFDLFVLLTLAAGFLFAAGTASTPARLFLVVTVLGLLLAASFGAYFLVVFFLLNARIVLRREKRSLANSLSLLAALGVAALLAAAAFMRGGQPEWLRTLWGGLNCLIIFYLLHTFVFLTTLILFNLARPKGEWDYIIVLGCGLAGGEVTPLLAARIRQALACAEKQTGRSGKTPVLVMSGGQGADEPRAEAEAMRDFAVAQGYAAGQILTEERSVNTEENMRFSRTLIEKHAAGAAYKSIFVTNNFHLLRAARYARQAGLSPEGLGAKTAWYYVPNAVMREFAAFLAMHKVKYAVAAVAAFALGLVFPEAALSLARIFLR
ncbi:MAG: YdcF family protein [Gracilibacteraceae bacterium]|jgi:uncharacterized SAM-binding protein YcdF (DUF218 family)|nr:YdcF family protein [Gracilibacteraceae bacterium]